ncbi:acyl-CoA dehydrogenase family protein, partial [Intestinimonas massiliensis]
MQFTEDQQMIQQLARDFAESELAPIAAEIDREERIPKEIIEKMAEIGFTALNVPEEYGGPGLDTVCKVLVVSELARQCASTAEVIAVHTLVNDIFLKHGTEAQKQKYLTAAVEGKIGAFALTEAGAGSDAAAAKTKAVVDG